MGSPAASTATVRETSLARVLPAARCRARCVSLSDARSAPRRRAEHHSGGHSAIAAAVAQHSEPCSAGADGQPPQRSRSAAAAMRVVGARMSTHAMLHLVGRRSIPITNTAIDSFEIVAYATSGHAQPQFAQGQLSARNLVSDSDEVANSGNKGLSAELGTSPVPLRRCSSSRGSSAGDRAPLAWHPTEASPHKRRDSGNGLLSWRSAPAVLADSEQLLFEAARPPAAAVHDSGSVCTASPQSTVLPMPPLSAPQLRHAPPAPHHAARVVPYASDASLQRSARDTPAHKQLPGSASLPTPGVGVHARMLAESAFLEDDTPRGAAETLLASLSASAALSTAQQRSPPPVRETQATLERVYSAQVETPRTPRKHLKAAVAQPLSASRPCTVAAESAPAAAAPEVDEGPITLEGGLAESIGRATAAAPRALGAPPASFAPPPDVLQAPARRWPVATPRVTLSMLLPSDSSMFDNPYTHRSQALAPDDATPRPPYSSLPPRRHIYLHRASDASSDPRMPLPPTPRKHTRKTSPASASPSEASPPRPPLPAGRQVPLRRTAAHRYSASAASSASTYPHRKSIMRRSNSLRVPALQLSDKRSGDAGRASLAPDDSGIVTDTVRAVPQCSDRSEHRD